MYESMYLCMSRRAKIINGIAKKKKKSEVLTTRSKVGSREIYKWLFPTRLLSVG